MAFNKHFIRTYGAKGKRTISVTPFSPILNARQAVSRSRSDFSSKSSSSYDSNRPLNSSIDLGSEPDLKKSGVSADITFDHGGNSTCNLFKMSSPIVQEGKQANLSRSIYDESNNGDRTPSVTLDPDIHNSSIFEGSLSTNDVSQTSILRKRSFAESLLPLTNRESNLDLPDIYHKVLEECNQTEAITLEQYLVNKAFVKLGEGTFAEVFRCSNTEGKESIIKIMPVEGKELINEEEQKKFEDILAEIVIARELSSLRHKDITGRNQTNNFIELLSVACCRGRYPQKLLLAWKEWDKKYKSENDCPDIFNKDQYYIVMEFPFGGVDLEHFPIKSTKQAESIIQQITFALAAAEEALLFEHRDLHWSNVLIQETEMETCACVINDHKYEIPTNNVYVSIIDFTLSRLEQDGCISFFNLSKDDELFKGEGDYQFEIYRMMREKNENEWKSFHAKTNVYWLHYLTDKLINEKKYPRGKKRKKFLSRLYDNLLKHESSYEVVTGELLTT
ncbi:uncharacterized protein TRIADDRAFT_63724 [Trichoplax adhaerens]|uniref:non-specific serine/threonine protein kinase n=1 Tax=Trichoplax adhaerens TaxID=10228 RepID=B3RRC3_TRIAD|nr:hypothetical protein TRIADDRAFT_63724 [Trichoplax adhaerens]EDV26318.1 hypothetical protein TRIADDRAFT_63724 [Trichoplax adhaerens]|eukprot:XP_002110314.1 hypothetical protein TRIADDRAFT_63724 [Trichoplax adhaerens]